MKFKLEWMEEITDRAEVYDAFESLRPYSGRGMYGRKCPAMSVENETEVRRLCAAAALVAVEMTDETVERFDPMAFAASMEVDSMGLGLVVYWPGMELSAYPEGEDG